MSTRPARLIFMFWNVLRSSKIFPIGHSQLSQVGPLQVYVVNTLTHFQHIIHSSMSTTPSRSWNSTKTTPGGPSCLCLKKAWKWFTTQWAQPQAGPLHWRPHLPLHSPHPELVLNISTCHPLYNHINHYDYNTTWYCEDAGPAPSTRTPPPPPSKMKF